MLRGGKKKENVRIIYIKKKQNKARSKDKTRERKTKQKDQRKEHLGLRYNPIYGSYVSIYVMKT